MFRIAFLAVFLSSAPAMAMDYARCVGLLADAFEAKDELLQTVGATLSGAPNSDHLDATRDGAKKANQGIEMYLNGLADLCESLR